MQTTEGLNLLNSLKHHENGLALKSKWAQSSFWDKSRNIHPGRCCRLCWSAGNYTWPNTKESCLLPQLDFKFETPEPKRTKRKSPSSVSTSTQNPFSFPSCSLVTMMDSFYFFCFQRHLYLREKSKICEQPLPFAFCLKQGIPYYNARNWFAFRCSMKSVLEATLDYEQSSTQTLHNAPKPKKAVMLSDFAPVPYFLQFFFLWVWFFFFASLFCSGLGVGFLLFLVLLWGFL